MLSRLRTILLEPRDAWVAIGAAPRSALSMLAAWILPLALLPFAATLLRVTLFTALFGATTGFAVAPYVLADAAAQYAFLVAWTCAVALATDWLAPRFGGTSGFGRATTVVGYALTPAFVMSLAGIVPGLGVLGFAGAAWAVMLLRLGLPKVMASPEERSTSYTAAVTLIAVLLALLAMLVPSCQGVGQNAGASGPLPAAPVGDGTQAGSQAGGTRSPDERLSADEQKGLGNLDLDGPIGESMGELIDRFADRKRMAEIERLSREAADVARIPFKRAEPSALGELIPQTACDQPRVTLESTLSKLPVGDVAIAKAEFGTPGRISVRMEIGDQSSLATGMAQIRRVLPERTQTTAYGYQRFRQEGSVFVDDRWDSRSGEARFVALVANRFAISAVATGVESPACAEAAVRAVDWPRLESLANEPPR